MISPATARLSAILFAAISIAITGCESTSTEPRTEADFTSVPVYDEASQGQNQRIATHWTTTFRDSRMEAIVKEALANNPNLKATAHRLRATRESLITSRARRLPTATAGATGRTSVDADSGEDSQSYGLSFSASWEPDLWGRLRDLDQAVTADYAASVARYRGARLSIAANAAQSYYNLITAQKRVTLAEVTLKSFETNLRIIERGYPATPNNIRDLDVAFSRNNVSSAKRNLVAAKLNRDNAARSLEVLLGRYPSAEIRGAAALPELTSTVPAGLPADLLSRRPDLVEARARIFAAESRSSAAEKSLLPDLRLTASGSQASSDLSRALNPQFILFSAAASLTQSVYRGGALRAESRAALERQRAELDDYTQVALFAFREIEAALAAERSLAEQEIYLKEAAEKAELAEKFAENGYTEGLEGASILSLLEAQRRNNNARAAIITLANQRIQNRIDLFLALGGSY